MDSAIAIVGMSCRFAGCSAPAALWRAIMSRRSLLTEPGPDTEIPFGQQNVFARAYPARIGQLGDLYACVPAQQNFPRQLNAGENQDLYFATQLAMDALADAAMRPHAPEAVRGTVRLGYAPPFNASTVNWLQHTAFLDQTMEILHRFLPHAPQEALDETRAKLLESLPQPDASAFLTGSGYRFVSWIARECSFSGAATIMDAGLISGAATVMDALADLRTGNADVVLTGVQEPPLSRAYLEGLSGEVQFSTRAELHPFSSSPDGTIPGEGGVFLVLKRREDALRDHDRIYALIRSVAIGHNPSNDPSAILSDALARAGAPAHTIGLIEADGSGIADMEAREIDGVQRLWGEHRPGGALVGIGSVKGNIGNTLRVSMGAGLVKAALALHHRTLPPQLAPEHPLEAISNLSSSVYLLTEARPWITGDSANPRRAVVIGSNFDSCDPEGMHASGKGGRSAAIVLEEEPEVRS